MYGSLLPTSLRENRRVFAIVFTDDDSSGVFPPKNRPLIFMPNKN